MWIYKDKEINSHDDLHPDCTDIVYLLTFESGRAYIGKKGVRAIRKRPPLKGKKLNRRILTNLQFVSYEGSSEEIENEIILSKEIFHQCSNKRTATYIEAGWLFEVDALFNPLYLNKNIGGVYFDNAMSGYLEGYYND